MKQIKMKNNFNSVLILLIFLIFGFVVLGAVQKRQDTRSSATSWPEDSLCKAIGGTCTAYSMGACKTAKGLSGVTVANKCGPLYYNDKYCCISDNNGKGPGAEACVAKGGSCQTNSKGYLPTSGTACIVDGKKGTYKTALCIGGYNNYHLCCIPLATCVSKGGVCLSSVRTCQIAESGTVVTGTTGCAGKTPICCKP